MLIKTFELNSFTSFAQLNLYYLFDNNYFSRYTIP